jgi:UDP-N-acetylmuramoylalanine--D-glutamate ligase
MNAQDFFKDKKVTVMGLGLLGRGVGDAAYIAKCGAAEVLVTDLKTEAELADSVAKLKAYDNIRFVLGEHRMEDFEGRDLVLVAAGVLMDSPYVAREAGAPTSMSAALFARLSGIPIIGITGTRGKSTVTHLIHHVLAHTTEGAPVILGGNVRGISNLKLLEEVHQESLAVMELDSWQLQGFGWEGISPQVAVFTNFMDDHLNYYHGDRDAYFADKANIFLHQEESDVLVTTPEVFARAEEFARGTDITLGQEVVLADASLLPEDVLLAMPGEHNRQNAALALAALRGVGLTDEEIFDGFASFPGVPGRLELLGDIDIASGEGSVKVYNDNNATTPQASVAALSALDPEGARRIVLIVGGADKEIDVAPLAEAIEAHARATVLLPGTGTDRLRGVLENFDGEITEAADLTRAIDAGLDFASPGDTLLFSPGFASFGLFKNEYDRNDQFVELIRARQ